MSAEVFELASACLWILAAFYEVVARRYERRLMKVKEERDMLREEHQLLLLEHGMLLSEHQAWRELVTKPGPAPVFFPQSPVGGGHEYETFGTGSFIPTWKP